MACTDTTIRQDPRTRHWHIVDTPVVIENPGTQDKNNVAMVYIWTDDKSKHEQKVYPNRPLDQEYEYLYLPAVVLHEVAHTMGLTDLYSVLNRDFPSVMDQVAHQDYLSRFDLNYLKQVYREYWD